MEFFNNSDQYLKGLLYLKLEDKAYENNDLNLQVVVLTTIQLFLIREILSQRE